MKLSEDDFPLLTARERFDIEDVLTSASRPGELSQRFNFDDLIRLIEALAYGAESDFTNEEVLQERVWELEGQLDDALEDVQHYKDLCKDLEDEVSSLEYEVSSLYDELDALKEEAV
jgi:predicted nuclease with TOPRIM domain